MIGGHGGNIYELARQVGCDPAEIIDLSSNVNPLGPPAGLCDNLVRQIDTVSALPEVDNQGIIRCCAEHLGVSAGACNLASHLAGQNDRNFDIIERYSIDGRFINLGRFPASTIEAG